MGSYTTSDDSPYELHRYVSEQQKEIKQLKDQEALDELSKYPFRGNSDLNKSLAKYHGATRVNIPDYNDGELVKSHHKFLTIAKLLQQESSVTPSHGLMVKKGSKKEFVHMLLELNESSSVGVFLFDSKRMLSVPQVHGVERIINETGLKGGIIVANNIGMPAKQEAQRINQVHGKYGIITIEHYDSMEKRLNGM